MFTAVASLQADRVHGWLAKWSARTQAGLSARECFDESFGCALEEGGRCDFTHGLHSVLLGTFRDASVRTVRPQSKRSADVTPLEAARQMFQERGLSALRDFKGQFAIVFWNRVKRDLFAVRDPLGLAPLYYAEHSGALLLADNLDAFEEHTQFDPDYIAQFIAAQSTPNTTRTIRQGVRALPPGTWLNWKDGRITTDRYWSIMNLSPSKMSRQEASTEFFSLLQRALKAQIDPGGRTWSHLSGGLDSSSVVSAAASMEETGTGETRLGGTVTIRDSLGNADEAEFVNEVVQRYGVRNVTVSDPWPWQSDEEGLPLTDRPSRDYPFYARDREMARAVTAAGGTSVLSGIGPDIYLPNTAAHCPDLLWTGHLVAAARELHGWTVARRGSYWRVAINDGLLPLMSRTSSAAIKRRRSHISGWFTTRFRQQRNVDGLLAAHGRYAGPRGHYYTHHVAAGLSALAERLSNWLYSPGVEIRHPLFDLPLVEFCLRLPYGLRTDVYWSKPVLRAAMKGILPERVRTRASAGIFAPRIFWAFRHERQLLQRLLLNPVLGDLGCIEPRQVRQALDSFDVYGNGQATPLYVLLSLETWLSAKSGRWTVDERTSHVKENSYGTNRTDGQRGTLTPEDQVRRPEHLRQRDDSSAHGGRRRGG